MTDNSGISLSVFFPAYYDEKNIGKVVDAAVKVLEEMKLKEYEIIIIEDGSPDRTGEVADELALKYEKVRVIHHEKNMGYGATLKDGFLSAKLDYVFYTDGDNQFDLEELKKFVALLPYSDIIVGYRKHKQYSLYRKFTSLCYNYLLKLVFDIHYWDIDCAFKLFKTDLFKKIKIDSVDAFIDAEIMLKANLLDYKVTEIGVMHLPRVDGISTGARPSVIIRTIKEVFTYRKEYFAELKKKSISS
ncbi:MAG TPA: glycosyltransferase family 2 protein [Ignavibacteria bacterium]|nr:glycosyltransferase family 2 protein [Bacteroidota bacterium]HRI85486.1 glycosyltransferase family 2 protein [Ignavibacteria bacterium]HRJ99707.1 glycosyltransferase family 2 protein [Ignavibacteria bacterium]